MYSLDSAIGKLASEKGKWSDVDLGNMICNQIFVLYREVIAILTHPEIPNKLALNLEDIRTDIVSLDITFNQFLINNGSNTLPTSNQVPEIKPRYAKYADAFHAGYRIIPTSPDAAWDANVPKADKTWLYMPRPDTDFKLWYESILPTVNGFFHRTDYDVTGGYIVDGNKTAQISGKNQIGLHSFRELGKIKIIPITPEMVKPIGPDVPLFQTALIDVGVDLTQHTVMLVTGGYLHLDDEQTFGVQSETVLSVDMQNSPYINRYFESRHYLDLSSLELTMNDDQNQVSVEELTSDKTIRAYLSLSQSFVVLLDNKDVYVQRDMVRTALMPGMYVSYERPIFPLVIGHGMMADYWYTFEDQQWSLTCTDGFRHQRQYYTTDPLQENSINDTRVPNKPVTHSFGTFLKITADLA